MLLAACGPSQEEMDNAVPCEVATVPEHMAALTWQFDPGAEFEEMVFDFTIHNDPKDFSDDNGLYFMVSHSTVLPDTGFYFGLQTDVSDPARGKGRGKGVIFSRWGERDLAWARPADGGWTESSGHEGDFIGVRISYDWGVGDYRMRIGPDDDAGDQWLGVWITDLESSQTTWVGSLRFPGERSTLRPSAYSTLEIYGAPICPMDIPEWRVTMRLPRGDGSEPSGGEFVFSPFNGEIMNSDVNYDPESRVVHLSVGGLVERTGERRFVEFETRE